LINISFGCRKQIELIMNQIYKIKQSSNINNNDNNDSKINYQTIFDKAAKEIFSLLNDSFLRFMETADYEKLTDDKESNDGVFTNILNSPKFNINMFESNK